MVDPWVLLSCGTLLLLTHELVSGLPALRFCTCMCTCVVWCSCVCREGVSLSGKLINGGAAIDLSHKIKSVNILFRLWIIPMCIAVLMPRYSSAKSGVFNKQTFGKGRKVGTINSFRQF